mmetsp:Transcript_119133/g.336998  ORF Transcript_119133/g.336998 Transcript_119133/m.336998 type:complete len:293 (-) Transcript_119133:421-1299(-)
MQATEQRPPFDELIDVLKGKHVHIEHIGHVLEEPPSHSGQRFVCDQSSNRRKHAHRKLETLVPNIVVLLPSRCIPIGLVESNCCTESRLAIRLFGSFLSEQLGENLVFVRPRWVTSLVLQVQLGVHAAIDVHDDPCAGVDYEVPAPGPAARVEEPVDVVSFERCLGVERPPRSWETNEDIERQHNRQDQKIRPRRQFRAVAKTLEEALHTRPNGGLLQAATRNRRDGIDPIIAPLLNVVSLVRPQYITKQGDLHEHPHSIPGLRGRAEGTPTLLGANRYHEQQHVDEQCERK